MTDTTFVDQQTIIQAAWCNDINDHVYNDTPISPSTTVHDSSKISNSIKRVANIAAIRSITPVTTYDVETQGYYTAGDGGHGTYYGVTGAAAGTYVDNGGAVIVPTGGDGSSAWLLKPVGVLSARQFGMNPSQAASVNTAALQAALTWTGIGGRVRVPRGTYQLNGSITLLAGQTLEGDGWSTVPGSYALSGGTVLVQNNTTDINFIQTVGASDAAQVERGGIQDIALYNSVSGATVGTGYYAIYARQQRLHNVYISGFRTAISQQAQCWLWDVRHVRCMDFVYGLVTDSSAEDSQYYGVQFFGRGSGSTAVHQKNQCANNTYIGCYAENVNIGWLLDQYDTNGNGTGTVFPMHATLIGCLIEDVYSAGVMLLTTNQGAAQSSLPGITMVHTRAYNGGAYATPNNGQSLLYAMSASQISVRDTYSGGFSYGATLGMSAYGYTYTSGIVGPVLWELDNNSTWGTARARGQQNNFTLNSGESANVSLSTAALTYSTPSSFVTVPFNIVDSGRTDWAYTAGNAIKPSRGAQRVRIICKLTVDAAPTGRYVIQLLKTGVTIAALCDFTNTSAGSPITLFGEWWDVPNGTTDQYTVQLYSTASGFAVDTLNYQTYFKAALIGN